ncbi:hypothetical protein [Mesorhizobium sp. M0435]|uniref:hypothetical protein n=1 Tax=unclassified Mesorhizobium TaxID=325217 RepID=UPI00333C0265
MGAGLHLHRSVGHSVVEMNDRVEHRLMKAAGVFLNLGAADAWRLGVFERLMR